MKPMDGMSDLTGLTHPTFGGRKKMGVLNAAARNKLPTKAFAMPGKRAYPIEDQNHARNALSRVSQFGSAEEKSEVRGAVKSKFPGIGKAIGGKKAAPKKGRPF